MKKLTAVVLTCMVAFAVVAQINVEGRRKRGSYNAIARMKVVLCCIDQGGHPLSDVMVWSGVSLDGNPETFTLKRAVEHADFEQNPVNIGFR